MNQKTTILHPELVAIDGSDGKIYFGGSADWFSPYIQRSLRQGAVVASEVLSYLAATRSSLWDLYPPQERRTQAEFEALVRRVWKTFTPSARERLELDDFMEGLKEHVSHAGHTLTFDILRIPPAGEARPSADRCQSFVDDAMACDIPVAFLTRRRTEDGRIICVWSLIVARRGSQVVLAEDGRQKTLDLRLWHDTASLGGAMVFAHLHPL